ncbi:hypothetical protein CFB46_08880 [Burkholderia sp. HI2761]|uniref:hypothetical protein n=1 Tax=unclassified Burkholderia TaxID=2613784 RepID=UPI000B79D977|nr:MULTISPECIES: hypothetical protein [unclassified Burkholderia]MPV58545.1 hypothetical protein [Burkholderia sp. BE24]OXJ26892.1 hypothetical protein CFB46_08880 [Burkholderia sp. HI2761]
MKHGNGIRFAITGSARRRAGRLRACGATARRAAARTRRPSRLAVPFAAAPVAGATVATAATAARCAGNHSLAASAATFVRAVAPGRAARRVPPPLAKHRPAAMRRRSLSSVRLTLMQDPSS